MQDCLSDCAAPRRAHPTISTLDFRVVKTLVVGARGGEEAGTVARRRSGDTSPALAINTPQSHGVRMAGGYQRDSR